MDMKEVMGSVGDQAQGFHPWKHSIKYEEFLRPCDSADVSSWKLVKKEVRRCVLGVIGLCVGGRFGHVVVWRVCRKRPALH